MGQHLSNAKIPNKKIQNNEHPTVHEYNIANEHYGTGVKLSEKLIVSLGSLDLYGKIKIKIKKRDVEEMGPSEGTGNYSLG